MIRVEKLVKELWKYASEDVYGEQIKVMPLPDHRRFPAMTYHTAMSRHGVDKPDLRIKDEVCSPSLFYTTFTSVTCAEMITDNG